MLDRPPIFLGGQGGAVGPVRVGYGTVVAAGSVLRADVGDDRLVFASPPESHERQHQPLSYRNLSRVVANNLAYLANLVALEHWYREVRMPFFERQALGDLVYEGALDMLALAKSERTKRLSAMAAKVPRSTEAAEQFAAGVDRLATVFMEARGIADASAFLRHIEGSRKAGNYLETMQGLSPEAKAAGVQWLEEIVARLTQEAADILPAMDLPSA
jgi:UDP-N-acetylglucosamine/UDP-N-acetylgalactosamine diphosphorylase